MTNTSSRILLVYPYPNIDTNPTMIYLLKLLAEHRLDVDVLLDERNEGYPPPRSYGESIHLRPVPAYSFFDYQEETVRGLLELLKGTRYSVLVGVDPHGIVTADHLNRWADRPLVYMSFEIMVAEEIGTKEDEALKSLELAACRRTALVLVQDEERADFFSRQTSFPRDRIIEVPVAPPPEEVVKTDYLRKKLEIPPNRRIVLYSGSLEAWAGRDDFAEMVSYWKDDYCLVIHSRARVHKGLARYLQKLAETERIYISTDPVASQDMTELLASGDFALAPYKPGPEHWMTGDNLYHLGFASGKISYYAMCGLPILARSLRVFEREFIDYKCGKTFQRLEETGRLLEEMDRNYSVYSNEARRFYRERLNPVEGMREFCAKLLNLVDGAEGKDLFIPYFSELQARLDELQTSHVELQARCEELQASHADMVAQRDALESQCRDLQTQYEELQNQHDELRAERDELSTQRAKLQARKDELESRLVHFTYLSGILRQLPGVALNAVKQRLSGSGRERRKK